MKKGNKNSHLSSKMSEKYPAIKITKGDLVAFAKEHNVAGSSSRIDGRDRQTNPNVKSAGDLWSELGRLNEGIRGLNYRSTPLLQLDLGAKFIDQKVEYRGHESFSMDGLVNLVEEFDGLRAENSTLTTGEILGKGFGDAKLGLLRSFVDCKKEQFQS